MLSEERFNALLSGNKPQNEFEKEWIKNYNETWNNAIEESLEKDKEYSIRKEKAYHEFYDLIKSSFPKEFFCKNPMKEKSYYLYQQTLSLKIMPKVKLILSNSLLRKKYNIPEKNPNFQDHGYISSLAEKFWIKELNKKFEINLEEKNREFERYANKEFITKAKEIENKYNVRLTYWFDINLWCTDYEEYREYKA